MVGGKSDIGGQERKVGNERIGYYTLDYSCDSPSDSFLLQNIVEEEVFSFELSGIMER